MGCGQGTGKEGLKSLESVNVNIPGAKPSEICGRPAAFSRPSVNSVGRKLLRSSAKQVTGSPSHSCCRADTGSTYFSLFLPVTIRRSFASVWVG